MEGAKYFELTTNQCAWIEIPCLLLLLIIGITAYFDIVKSVFYVDCFQYTDWCVCEWVCVRWREREQRSKNLIPIMFIKLSLSIQLNILNGFPITFNEKKKPIKFVTLISQFVIEFHLSCRKLVSFHGAFKRAFGFVAQLFFLSLSNFV